jgi:hypothetical protein
MGTCAKFSKRRQGQLLCRSCVRVIEYPFLSTKTTYGATGAKDLVRIRNSVSGTEATCRDAC